MARLRHFAVCVRDLEKSAKFYHDVFDLKEVGRETIEIGSAIYMSDGVINLALLNFAGSKGNDIKGDPTKAVGANHFGFQVDDLAETQKKIEAAGGTFFFDLGVFLVVLGSTALILVALAHQSLRAHRAEEEA